MDYSHFQKKAIEFIFEKKWDQLIAKNRDQKATLFDHALASLDNARVLVQTLEKKLALTESEIVCVLAGALLHDAGKGSNQWQRYVLGDHSQGVVYDTDRNISQSIACEFFEALGYSGDHAVNDVYSSIELHMTGAHNPVNTILHLKQKHGNSRWMLLADLVRLADGLASCLNPQDAINLLLSKKSVIRNHIYVTHYQVQRKSIIWMNLLHRVLNRAFVNKGWRPLSAYSSGSVYIATEDLPEPTKDEVIETCVLQLQELFDKDMSEFVVGKNVCQSMFFPEFFDYNQLDHYMWLASTRVSRKENLIIKKKWEDVSRRYCESIGVEPTPENLEFHAHRLNSAYPEMAVFRFLKDVLHQDFLGTEVSEEAREHYREKFDKDFSTPVEIAKFEFERVFGEGSYKLFSHVSTWNPVMHMQLIDRYWDLSPKNIDVDIDVSQIGLIAKHDLRLEILVQVLTRIATKVFNALEEGKRESYRVSSLPRQVAEMAISEVLYPTFDRLENVKQMAMDCLQHYGVSKHNVFLSSGEKICPNCNRPFTDGMRAKVELFDNPTAYTNRAPAFRGKKRKNIFVCPMCQMERYLLKLVCPTSHAMVIRPRPPVARNNAQLIQNKALYLFDQIQVLITEVQNQYEYGIHSIHLFPVISEKLDEITSKIRFSHDDWQTVFSDANFDSRKILLEKEILNHYQLESWDMDLLNEYWGGTEFADKNSALEYILSNFVDDDDLMKIKAKVNRVSSNAPFGSPNLIILPWPDEIFSEDENDSVHTLKEIYIGLWLAVNLSASVTILDRSTLQTLDPEREMGGIVQFTGGSSATRLIANMISAYYKNKNLPEPQREDNTIPFEVGVDLLKAIHASIQLTPLSPFTAKKGLLRVLLNATRDLGGFLQRIERKRGKRLDKKVIEQIKAIEAFYHSPDELREIIHRGTIYIEQEIEQKSLKLGISQIFKELRNIFVQNDDAIINMSLSPEAQNLRKIFDGLSIKPLDRNKTIRFISNEIYYRLKTKSYFLNGD